MAPQRLSWCGLNGHNSVWNWDCIAQWHCEGVRNCWASARDAAYQLRQLPRCLSSVAALAACPGLAACCTLRSDCHSTSEQPSLRCVCVWARKVMLTRQPVSHSNGAEGPSCPAQHVGAVRSRIRAVRNLVSSLSFQSALWCTWGASAVPPSEMLRSTGAASLWWAQRKQPSTARSSNT